MKIATEKDVGPNDLHYALEDFILGSFWDSFGDLPVGIIVIDRNAITRFFNSLAGFFVGVQPMRALGKPVEALIPESQIVDTLSRGIPHYEKHRLINGRHLKFSTIPIKVHGKVFSAVEFIFDNSDNVSVLGELSELQEKYSLLDGLLDEAFEELGAVDKEGKLTYVSKKSAQNMGVSRDEILGRDISAIDNKCHLKKVASTGVPYVGRISRPHKEVVPCVVTPIRKNSEVSGAVCRSVFTNMDQANEFITRMQNLDEAKKTEPHLKSTSGCKFSVDDIVGQSKAINYAKEKALRVAEGDSTILITGESGTGKELFAQAIHMASLRRNGPLVRVNCAGIPETLLESELFGYEPGSFTGAHKAGKPGKFELAHNGTIFLDEAGDMSMGMQAKLLRVIQESEFERVGGTVTYEVDVRIIAATNRDLWGMVDKGQFREDLYYRLDVVNIHVPSLRERIADIPFLIEHFIPLIKNRARSKVKNVSQEVLDCFMGYDWPGNVRELKNVLEGAMNLNIGESIDMQSLPSKVRKKISPPTISEVIDSEGRITQIGDRKAIEKNMIRQALKIKNGNKRQAAIYLNMCRSTFYNKLKQYNIETQALR
ncbi:MAG: sigma 54-interacting transcriptional regulator [Deltaproteobacteria bacterium]|nr:sigma 54-interacting transcriptional regulator [Deltaproteobacteria bacterium]